MATTPWPAAAYWPVLVTHLHFFDAVNNHAVITLLANQLQTRRWQPAIQPPTCQSLTCMHLNVIRMHFVVY